METHTISKPTAAAGSHGSHAARRSGRSGNGFRNGFSLIELVIVVVIIGIIAAIAIPRMSRGSAGAADAATAQNVNILRNALDMYQTEHNGVYPAPGTGVTVQDLLTQYSNIDGTGTKPAKDAANGYIYGPYLRGVPPITVGANKGKNGIAVSTTSATAPTADGNTAWLYNSADGTLAPNASGNDSAGKAYANY